MRCIYRNAKDLFSAGAIPYSIVAVATGTDQDCVIVPTRARIRFIRCRRGANKDGVAFGGFHRDVA
jgi:hypothetical protein